MIKFFQKTKGSISIFLVLIMLPMFTCAGLIVDGARISAARTAISGAGDLAMNAALSEYNDVLKDAYGLFAMSETTEELEKNVKRYFINTINNEGILAASDSYTRSYINSISSLFSTDEISFDNIVDTEYEEFKLLKVGDSALANPAVLERQIVEYMKYRGPISMGTGLLTKLNLLGETAKQTKAMEAKIDYEKNLDDVQGACETAYNAIVKYNKLVTSDSKYASSDYLTKMVQDIKKAKTETEKMAQYIAAYKVDDLEVERFCRREFNFSNVNKYSVEGLALSLFDLDSNIKSKVDNYYNKSESETPEADTLDYIEICLGGTVDLQPDGNGKYEPQDTAFTNSLVRAMVKIDAASDLKGEIAAINACKDISGAQEALTYIMMYEYYYEKLTEEEQKEYEAKYDAYCEVGGMIIGIQEICADYRDGWKSEADKAGETASKTLYEWYADLEEIDSALADAIEALEALEKQVKKLDTTRTAWGNSVENLSDSDVKNSMQNDYNNSARDLHEEAVNALKTELENNKSHFSKLKEKFDSIKYCGKKICMKEYGSVDFYNRFSGSISKPDAATWSDVSGVASGSMSKYVTADVTTGITPEKFAQITEEQQFFKYLKNTCISKDTDKTSKEDAKAQRKQLINGGGSTVDENGEVQKQYGANDSKSADLGGITATGSYVGVEGLTAEISKAIEDLSKEADGSATAFGGSDVNADGSDDDMADNCKANLAETTNMLAKLATAVESARDYVYLEEYFTEMFSCYTTSPEARNLSDDLMTSNKFFRSEVEYILYGLDTVEGNLNAAKASVFGVRFALNSVFALTSSHTRTPALTAATAIAGWTGFGVPIVQTVILLVWALAESMVDLDQLCKGESVVLYKTNTTWMLGLNGMIEKGRDIAATVIDDVFTKIENVAVDSIDTLNDDITAYVSNTTAGVVDSIHGTIMTAVETLAVQIIGESNYNLSKDDVEGRVDELLDSLKSAATGDSVSDKATRLAVEVVRTGSYFDLATGETVQIKGYLVEKIYSAYSDAKNGVMTSISESIQDMLNKVADPIKNKINEVVASVGEELKTEVSEIIREGGDQVKEKVTSAIDGYLGKLGGADGGGGTAAAAGFSMSYKEYMKTFVVLFVGLNKTSMLQRTAELIQANIYQSDKGFDISKAYTMVGVNATVSIHTTFFDVPVTTGVGPDGEPVYELNFGNIGTGRHPVKYVGFLGY